MPQNKLISKARKKAEREFQIFNSHFIQRKGRATPPKNKMLLTKIIYEYKQIKLINFEELKNLPP